MKNQTAASTAATAAADDTADNDVGAATARSSEAVPVPWPSRTTTADTAAAVVPDTNQRKNVRKREKGRKQEKMKKKPHEVERKAKRQKGKNEHSAADSLRALLNKKRESTKPEEKRVSKEESNRARRKQVSEEAKPDIAFLPRSSK
eukprot:jgi/Bigna1/143108/aug1.75_g17816